MFTCAKILMAIIQLQNFGCRAVTSQLTDVIPKPASLISLSVRLLVGTRLGRNYIPEKYKENFDVSNEGPSSKLIDNI